MLLDAEAAPGSPRDSRAPAGRAREQAARAIHEQGLATALRPLLASEAERALGYPAGASVTPSADPPPPGSFEWDRLGRLGNGFCVFVVAEVLRPWAAWAAGGSPVDPAPGGPSVLRESDALLALQAGGPGRSGFPRARAALPADSQPTR